MTKVLVIGDVCEDVYVYGKCERMSPAAPVPIFVETHRRSNLGMAGNVNENLLSLGVATDLLCQIGDIPVKTRYVSEKTNHMVLRVDNDAQVGRISFPRVGELINYDAIVIADYDKGSLSEEDLIYLCESHPRVFVDTKKIISHELQEAAFLIKINEEEFERTKHTVPRADNLIVTLSENGCAYQGERFPVEKVDVKDLAGAGDTFMAGLVSSWLKCGDIKTAISFANECATKVVQMRGVNVVGSI